MSLYAADEPYDPRTAPEDDDPGAAARAAYRAIERRAVELARAQAEANPGPDDIDF